MKTAASILILFANWSCFAQSPKSAPVFEIATVKLSGPGKPVGRPFQTSPGLLTIRSFSLRNCIMLAYQMQPSQIIAPGWRTDVRLDIVAKAAAPVDDQQLYIMLRALLAERLGLVTHVEQKEMPVYDLTLAKGGPKFSESATEGQLTTTQGPGGLSLQHVSMSELAAELSGKFFDRPLINLTGLKGRYDIRIDMAPVVAAAQEDRAAAVGAMMTVMQEQLGLKIESHKGSIEVLIVDHAERAPSEN